MRLRVCTGIILMLAAVLVSSVAYGAINTIVITPDNEAAMGWTHLATSMVYNTQYPAACGFSVAPLGTANAPGAGYGGFYGNTSNYLQGDRVNQVFLGTNNYSTVKLSDIRKLYYRSFVADYNTFDGDHYPRTPWQLQLAVTKSASYTNPTRYLMYRGWDGVTDDSSVSYPYQQKAVPYSGEFPEDGHYMTFNGQDCYTGGNGAWVDFVGANYDTTKPFVGDWPNVLRKYSGGKILAGTGYYPSTWSLHTTTGANPTETCLTFVIGSPGDEAGASISLAWADNHAMTAWLDYFVIGYNKNSDPAQYTEDWIYFRPSPTPGTVTTNHKSMFDKNIIDNPKGWKGNYFVVSGKVLGSPVPTSKGFTLADGSGTGIKIRVKMTEDMGWGPSENDWVRVKGVLHRFGFATTPPDIFVHPDDFSYLEVAGP